MPLSHFRKTTLISTSITTAGALCSSSSLSEKDIKREAKRKATNGTLEKLRTKRLLLTSSFLYFSTKIIHLNQFLLFRQGSTGHTDISPPVTLPLRHIHLFPNESASIPRSFLLSEGYKTACWDSLQCAGMVLYSFQVYKRK